MIKRSIWLDLLLLRIISMVVVLDLIDIVVATDKH